MSGSTLPVKLGLAQVEVASALVSRPAGTNRRLPVPFRLTVAENSRGPLAEVIQAGREALSAFFNCSGGKLAGIYLRSLLLAPGVSPVGSPAAQCNTLSSF